MLPKVLASFALAATLTAGLAGATATMSPDAKRAPTTSDVLISDYTYKPATTTVTSGTRIRWTNKDDDPHTVTADDGAFDSKGLGQGDAYQHVFVKPGRYPYHCAAHPFMKGVVIVTKGANR